MWVVVCVMLGLVTTVGVAWFGAWDSQRRGRWFGFEFRADAISGGAREDVGGAWSIYASPLAVHLTGGFSATPPESPPDATADETLDETGDEEDEEDDWDEESDEDGYVELVLPDMPELHDLPHGRERWGALTYGENPAFTEAELPRYTPGSMFGVVQQELASGWPRLALWSQRRLTGASSNRTEVHSGAWLIEKGTGFRGKTTHWWLPLHPVWPGLLIDTAFWGGVWFVLLWPMGFVAGRMKRARRRKRGRCAWCRYDLRGIDGGVCPECGGKSTEKSTKHRTQSTDQEEKKRESGE